MMRLHLRFRPMFRSYKPVTDTLRESVLPEAAPGEVADHVREELDNEHRGVEIGDRQTMVTHGVPNNGIISVILRGD